MSNEVIKILNRWSGKVLFEITASTMKDAVIAAIKSKADLSGADLSGATLSGANLYGADLSGATLSGANLYGANLYGANLYGTDLSWADLSGANLSKANLSKANLTKADLSWATLYGTDLSKANLSKANLSKADLSGADLSGATLSGAKSAELIIARTLIVPESGPFVGWKKCKDGILVKVGIPSSAKRSNANGRKCRADKVKVLEITGGHKTAISNFDPNFVYTLGKIVTCDKWEENRWIECGGGIHFFLTRIEAENYS
jgi:uncharacterized protein YjbI with pentapeptide repeats